MTEAIAQFFFYLAAIYMLSAPVLFWTRRMRLQDFTAYLISGMLLGMALRWLQPYPSVLNRIFFENNVFIFFANHLGLLSFLIILGLNFELSLFRWASNRVMRVTFSIAFVNFAALFLIGLFFFFERQWFPALFFATAFLTVGLGALVRNLLEVDIHFRAELTEIVQAGSLLDVLTIAMFATLHTVFQNLHREYGVVDLIFLVLFMIFSIPIIFRRRISHWLNRIPLVASESVVLIALGIFLITLNLAYSSGLSVFFIGFWAGLFLKNMIPRFEQFPFQRIVNSSSFIYLLPFADAGRMVIMGFPGWISLGYILLGLLFVVMMILGFYFIYLVKQEYYSWPIAVGMVPGGELSVLIIWLTWRSGIIGDAIGGGAILTILFTTIGWELMTRKFMRRDIVPEEEMF